VVAGQTEDESVFSECTSASLIYVGAFKHVCPGIVIGQADKLVTGENTLQAMRLPCLKNNRLFFAISKRISNIHFQFAKIELQSDSTFHT
jgi:hypothetical protein